MKEEDKLNVDFPETEKPQEAVAEPEAPAAQEVIPEEPVASVPSEDDIVLPFGDPAFVSGEEDNTQVKADDVPQMPLYDSDNYNNPVNAVGSEQNVSQPFENASFYGDYAGAEAQEPVTEVPPYQPYGAEAFSAADQSSFGTYGSQPADAQGGAPMDDNGYSEFGSFDNGYVPGNDQPQGGFDEYSQTGYQDAGAAESPFYQQEGYQEFGAQQQEGYGEEFAQPQASASSSASLDDEWFNNILGVDDAGQTFGGEQSYGFSESGEETKAAAPDSQQQAQYTNPGQTSYRPSGSGPNNNGRPTGSAPRTSASAGKGGSGGGKKMKLNRNGYMFIAFLAILLICIIIVVALIARGCSKKTKPTETVPSLSSEETTTETTMPSTAATLPDASAPIGYFVFSDNIGYRTWWDVFHTVYGIDIENNKDPRIAIIITYNKLDPATYTGPNSGDKLLLPPPGVLTGEIENTWSAGAAAETTAAAGETTANDEITSSIHIT